MMPTIFSAAHPRASEKTMKKQAAALACLSALVFGCGGSTVPLDSGDNAHRQSVVGGTPASDGNIGATVALMDPDYQVFFCTGTLVSPRVVVTAAHCLFMGNDVITSNQVAVLGGHLEPEQVPSSTYTGVQSLAVHPDFTMEFPITDDPDGLTDFPDVGVLVLDAPLPGIAPAPILPAESVATELAPGNALLIAGYGVHDMANQYEAAGVLYEGETPYVRNNAVEFVAGGSGSPDSCYGDSGGPAYRIVDGIRYLVGATSRASMATNTECGGGGVYALLPNHVGWIEENADGHFVAPDPGGTTPPSNPEDPLNPPDDKDDPAPPEDPGASEGANPSDPPENGGYLDEDDLPDPSGTGNGTGADAPPTSPIDPASTPKKDEPQRVPPSPTSCAQANGHFSALLGLAFLALLRRRTRGPLRP
jgi:hypothetical protein